MAFASLRLKPESGASRIKSADDAYSFLAHMRLSKQAALADGQAGAQQRMRV